MKIRISKDWKHIYEMSFPGNTYAAKRPFIERAFAKGSLARPWIDSMIQAQGKWVAVETDCLFEDQFNTEKTRVMIDHIDGICFGPEFKDVDDFLEKVQKRYDKDWPGRKVTPCIKNRIALGLIELTAEAIPFS